jgi:hypothetical protein
MIALVRIVGCSFGEVNLRSTPFEVESTDSVSCLKSLVTKWIGYPGSDFRLLYDGSCVEEDKLLYDYNIQHNSALYLIHQPRFMHIYFLSFDRRSGKDNSGGFPINLSDPFGTALSRLNGGLQNGLFGSQLHHLTYIGTERKAQLVHNHPQGSKVPTLKRILQESELLKELLFTIPNCKLTVVSEEFRYPVFHLSWIVNYYKRKKQYLEVKRLMVTLETQDHQKQDLLPLPEDTWKIILDYYQEPKDEVILSIHFPFHYPFQPFKIGITNGFISGLQLLYSEGDQLTRRWHPQITTELILQRMITLSK